MSRPPLKVYNRRRDEERYYAACEAGRIRKDYKPLAILIAEWTEEEGTAGRKTMAKRRRLDIKAILADPDLRRRLMVDTIRATQAREGIETTEEQAERAYYIVTEAEKTAFFDLERFRGGKGEPDQRHKCLCRLYVGLQIVSVSMLPDEISAQLMVCPWRIAALASWHTSFDAPALEPAWGIAVQGLATADDSRLLRNRWEIPLNE